MPDLPEIVDVLADRLHGSTFGGTRVTEAEGGFGADPDDEPAVYLELTLTDPVGETWPYEDVLSLRRAVLAAAAELAIDLPVYVHLRPATDQPQEEDENPLFV